MEHLPMIANDFIEYEYHNSYGLATQAETRTCMTCTIFEKLSIATELQFFFNFFLVNPDWKYMYL